MTRFLARFFADQSGATAIEYAFIAVGIGVAIVAVVTVIGTTLEGGFQNVSDGFN